MTGFKVFSLLPLAAAVEIPTDGIIGIWEKGGIIAVLLVAILAMWKADGKRQDKLVKIIEANTAAFTELKDHCADRRKVNIPVANDQRGRRDGRG